MDSSPLSQPDPEAAPIVDPRLEPTPDYGTVGQGSDIAGGDSDRKRSALGRSCLVGAVLAVGAGVILAVLVANLGSAGAGRSRSAGVLSRSNASPNSRPIHSQGNSAPLDRLQPQKQAEALLELAVGRSGDAVAQISSRVDRWQGKLNWNPQIATLTTAALNSNDMRVRESGIEVELAAYGLAKNSASLEYLLTTAASSDHAQKIWALWALGLMGNRGVETARVIQVLTTHLKDSDEDSRHWAVAGLALVGSTETVTALLQVMHNDPAPAVREAAACALAQSGMYTSEQRRAIIPQLLAYTNDPSLDAQTHAWAFQALGDITHQRLPNDSTVWRNWYESAKNN